MSPLDEGVGGGRPLLFTVGPNILDRGNRSLCLFDPRWQELCATKAGIK